MKSFVKWQPLQSRTNDDAFGICVDGTQARPEWIVHPNERLDDGDVQLMCATHNAAMDTTKERSVRCSSLVNVKHEPIVQIVMGAEVAQFTVRDARQVATQLLESIEAAMSDALLVRFIHDYVYRGKTADEAMRAVGHLLVMFRRFRESITDPTIVVPEGEQAQ